jgi:hypothetical protein
LAFGVWQNLAALRIAKHGVCVAWYGVLTEPNSMLYGRYHVGSVSSGMVSNLIIRPVLLGFRTVLGLLSEHGIF